MTPKEKAEELVDKFYYGGYKKPMFYDNAKQCALIAVDGIINIAYWGFMESGGKQEQEFWQEVKQEINKL
jgi:hypothetical protein